MLTHISDPCRYFIDEHLVESEVIRLLARPSRWQCDLVFIYTARLLDRYFKHLRAGNSAESFRTEELEFRWLRFEGVQQVDTRLGPNVPTRMWPQCATDSDWLEHEQKLLNPCSRLITGVECLPNETGFRCAIDLDSFGEHSWAFSSMHEARRTARVVRQDVDVVYRDAATDLIVNRSDPFSVEME